MNHQQFIPALYALLIAIGISNAFELKVSFGPEIPKSVLANKYSQVAKGFADAMLEKGRDTYGTPTPLFASFLDLPTMSAATAPECNVNEDQNLYRLLYSLSLVSGDQKYKQAADSALTWFLEHSSPLLIGQSGMLPWGESGWINLNNNGPTTECEHAAVPILENQLWRLSPERMYRAAQAYWEVNIYDKENGYFNRHCKSQGHAEYPRHGGFFILHWYEALLRTCDDYFGQYISTLVKYFNAARRPDGQIPMLYTDPNNLRNDQVTSLNYCLWNALPYMGSDSLSEKIRTFCLFNDDILLKNMGTGSPSFEKWPETGLQKYTITVNRYYQLQDAGELDRANRYKQAIVADARLYIGKQASVEWAGNCGFIIWHLLAAERLTGEKEFLDAAQAYGDEAIKAFFDPYPIPPVIRSASILSENHTFTNKMYYSQSNSFNSMLPLAMFLLGQRIENPTIRMYLPSDGI